MKEKETPEAKGENEGLSSAGVACAACGMPVGEWRENAGKGVLKDGVLYCSQSCAQKNATSALYPSPIGSGTP